MDDGMTFDGMMMIGSDEGQTILPGIVAQNPCPGEGSPDKL